MKTYNSLLAVVVPSLVFFSASGLPVLEGWTLHRQAWGNEGTYLVLEYSTNPEGGLSAHGKVRFRGTLVTEGGQETPVHGEQGVEDLGYGKLTRVWNFHTELGPMRAHSAASARPGCPDEMVLSGPATPSQRLYDGHCWPGGHEPAPVASAHKSQG